MNIENLQNFVSWRNNKYFVDTVPNRKSNFINTYLTPKMHSDKLGIKNYDKGMIMYMCLNI